jgi:hypothetical protein
MLLPKTIVSFIGADSAICVMLTDSQLPEIGQAGHLICRI